MLIRMGQLTGMCLLTEVLNRTRSGICDFVFLQIVKLGQDNSAFVSFFEGVSARKMGQI